MAGSTLAWKNKPVKRLVVVTSQKKKDFTIGLSQQLMQFIDYSVNNMNWLYVIIHKNLQVSLSS